MTNDEGNMRLWHETQYNFGKVYTPKSDISEGAKGNKDFQKETKRFFDEKRV